jgi:hypothetical protein
MASTAKTLTPFRASTPVVEVLPRNTVPMTDFEPPEPGHYIRRKPPSAPTQAQILAREHRARIGGRRGRVGTRPELSVQRDAGHG